MKSIAVSAFILTPIYRFVNQNLQSFSHIFVSLSNILEMEGIKDISGGSPAERMGRPVVGAAHVSSELFNKVIKREEGMRIIEVLLVFLVATFNLAAMTGRVRTDELVTNAHLAVDSSLLTQKTFSFLLTYRAFTSIIQTNIRIQVGAVMHMKRMILHSDANTFYASVEMVDNPEIKDFPLAVCGDTIHPVPFFAG